MFVSPWIRSWINKCICKEANFPHSKIPTIAWVWVDCEVVACNSIMYVIIAHGDSSPVSPTPGSIRTLTQESRAMVIAATWTYCQQMFYSTHLIRPSTMWGPSLPTIQLTDERSDSTAGKRRKKTSQTPCGRWHSPRSDSSPNSSPLSGGEGWQVC